LSTAATTHRATSISRRQDRTRLLYLVPATKIESIDLLPVLSKAHRHNLTGGSMRSMLKALATAGSMALLASGIAVADTVTTTFEPPDVRPGSVAGQNGWLSAVPGDIPNFEGYDQEVVSTDPFPGAPSGFGDQSLRHSNAAGAVTGEFFYQTYAAPTQVAAGEDLDNTEYQAAFSFISTTPSQQQPGLYMRISPDLVSPNGGRRGARMSFIGLRDTQDGIALTFFDTDADGEFVAHPLGTVSRDVEHRIRFWIKLSPGPNNDLVRMFIDGVDTGQCFTTWENFYPRVGEEVPAINSMQFRSDGNTDPSLENKGYLFDNVRIATSDGPGPRDCSGDGEGPPDDIDVDKTTQTRSALPGQLITYRVTVRNRGDAPVRGLRACDRAPRALTFVRATLPLERAAGGRLCLTIRLLLPGQSKTFRATFRLRQNVTADTVTNGAHADVAVASAPSPVPPDNAVTPRPRRRRVDRDAARIRVRTAPRACPAALNPRARAAC
jgi:uncharacterized repeat protein (TIGR01451 family)